MNLLILEQLRAIVGDENVSAAEADRALHAQDQSTHPPVLPDVVVWPNATEEVSAVVKLASANHITVIR